MTVANTDLTQGSALTTSAEYVVTGTGVFDDLMEAVNIHLSAQFQLGRITGADYATVYLGAMQSALQNSSSFVLGKEKTNAETAVLSQKEITEFAQTEQTTKIAPTSTSIMGKQATLYGEQAKGFKWNADQKYLKTLLDAWSINVSTAGVASTNIVALNAVGTGNMNDQISDAEPVG
jgi:hypothetical protein